LAYLARTLIFTVESERQTRKRRIDPKLSASGWAVKPFSAGTSLANLRDAAIEEYETDNGPADYALCTDAVLLGVVEAKKVTLGPQNVLTQSERYSRGATNNPLYFDGFHVPFLYSTNGEVIWFHDIRHPLNRSRRVSRFHTPAALREMFDRDFEGACQWLDQTPNIHSLLRPYQIEANQRIERAIADRKRAMLVAMATGTGKTFTLVNEVYRLMKSGVARRVLFLVDRRALAAQAVRAFASFEPEPGLKFDKIYEVYSQRFHREDLEEEAFDPKVLPASYLLDPKPRHTFVYVSTIQRMAINLFGRGGAFGRDEEGEEGADTLDIPIHAFDVVIADECHRGYTAAELSVWRNTLDHFDAIKIGLTATPAAHTTTYFKDVVYRYDYERAVREGYLVDYDVVSINSEVRMSGVFIEEGQQVGLVDPTTGLERLDILEDERAFAPPELEEKVTSPDSNQKIVEELKKYSDEHEQRYGRFPKTLIFAANDLPHTSHADQLVDLCRDVFGRGDSFVQKITGRVDRTLQRIREFRNRPIPGVVVTVDLLSTGVDIPDLEYIVFLRPVRSRILFEQMLGRGTRKGEKAGDKSHFVVFDCFGGTLIQYFRQATAITMEPPERTSRTIVEIIEDIWNNRDRDYNTRCLVKRLRRIEKEMSAEAREEFAAFIPDGDMGRFATELPRRLSSDFTGTMKILRDPRFQDLLVNYPRPPRVFYKAYETKDTVTSEWMISDLRPEDYLKAFACFVREKQTEISSIEILLDRPREWSTDALTELRQKLATSEEHFTEEKLQRAHAACYHKALVDIISMVKHAAEEQQPLLTADERVDRAMKQITHGQQFTLEQRGWLERIRAHLVENLSIGRDDFEYVPVFAREGGWAKANRVFDGRLDELIQDFNEAIAA
jgi:type I restriction enzyme, R subunit